MFRNIIFIKFSKTIKCPQQKDFPGQLLSIFTITLDVNVDVIQYLHVHKYLKQANLLVASTCPHHYLLHYCVFFIFINERHIILTTTMKFLPCLHYNDRILWSWRSAIIVPQNNIWPNYQCQDHRNHQHHRCYYHLDMVCTSLIYNCFGMLYGSPENWYNNISL